jgi:hypothetical protein
MLPTGTSAVRIEVVDAPTVTAELRERLFALFAAAYRDADAAYLDESLPPGVVWLVFDGDALSRSASARGCSTCAAADLVRMAGIACVAPSHRRQRVMVEVMQRAVTHGADADGLPW